MTQDEIEQTLEYLWFHGYLRPDYNASGELVFWPTDKGMTAGEKILANVNVYATA